MHMTAVLTVCVSGLHSAFFRKVFIGMDVTVSYAI
jgi:hypothetical protein